MTTEFPPECAERYRPTRLLASGGFASVWLAEQVGLERPVVVKLLHPDLLSSPALVERFLNEARVTAALSHPNIVILIDHGMEAGVPWIVFEYLPRGSLAGVLADRGALPWREALKITAQVAAALAEAHAHGILHRDIKPANLLEADPGVWKVADFGVAKWATHSTVTTLDGLVVGSPAYLSPEQNVGAPATPQSDIYALGLVTFQAIAGDLPRAFGGGPASPSELLRRAAGDDVPAPVLELLDRALELDPEKRHASAARMRSAAVDAVWRSAELRRGRESARRAWAVGAALACGVAAALVVAAPWRDGGTGGWTELPAAAPGSPSPTGAPAEPGVRRSVRGARELLDSGADRGARTAQADRLLGLALDEYHARPVGERRALWGWRGDEPGLAEAIRLHLALAPRAASAEARHDRLASFLRSIENAERENPLYWACRGLAAGTGPAPKDPGGIDPVALDGAHDAYTGLFLAVTEGAPQAVLVEVTLLAIDEPAGWRPNSAIHRAERAAWRLAQAHDALERGAGAPQELLARLAERHQELDQLVGAAPEDALERMRSLYDADRVPESRTVYLKFVAAAYHAPARPARGDAEATRGLRAAAERFLEMQLVRLLQETVGGYGTFGLAYDFAATVESTLKGTAAVEESALSLQRASVCADLERLAGAPGGPPKGASELERSALKARLYRATLVSRCLRAWLLPRHHEAAEAALARWPDVLEPARLKAARDELARIRAKRK